MAGGAAERAVVWMTTVALAGFVPSSVTAGGVITQLDAAGNPPQFRVIVLLNPPLGASWTV